MRILQVVTYISPDGAYGGPVRVAINQAKALHDLGHDVIVAAAAGGFAGTLPDEYDGFPVKLFPARRLLPKTGFAGLASPRMLVWLANALKGADVVHVHMARDLVTLPAAALALLLKKPLVVQTHGMIDRTEKLLAKPLDAILTTPSLRLAESVLYLTEKEKYDLLDIGGLGLSLQHLENAVEVPAHPAVEQASGAPSEIEVLYLARLHPRKRPEVVVSAAKKLSSGWPKTRFALVGPDEGAAEIVRKIIRAEGLQGTVEWDGPITPEKTIERMRGASIYVLPSVNEPFPMSVLEAMSLGIPVIVTDTCGLAAEIKNWDAGIICEESQASFDDALEYLLTHTDCRIKMGSNGRRAVQQKFSLSSLGVNLTHVYDSALKAASGSA